MSTGRKSGAIGGEEPAHEGRRQPCSSIERVVILEPYGDALTHVLRENSPERVLGSCFGAVLIFDFVWVRFRRRQLFFGQMPKSGIPDPFEPKSGTY